MHPRSPIIEVDAPTLKHYGKESSKQLSSAIRHEKRFPPIPANRYTNITLTLPNLASTNDPKIIYEKRLDNICPKFACMIIGIMNLHT